MKLAILQRVCPGYRVPLFSALSKLSDPEVRLFIGSDLPNSKVKSSGNLAGVRHTKVKTRFVRLGSRLFPWHTGLIDELRAFGPDVILCEGESHFLGYLQAIYYRARYAGRVGLIHWCFISLPGEANHRSDLAGRVKGYFRAFFDAFLVYSSYSRQCLLELGEEAKKIFVATNVGNVSRFLALSDALTETKGESRRRLGLPERFTVLYAGTLDENKRPEVLLELAEGGDGKQYNIVLLGEGPMLEALRLRAAASQLQNVRLPGRVSDELISYYRAADVLLIPGRGGIVISEAMACGLPVVVHEADGTESDLVVHGVTGYRLTSGTAEECNEVFQSMRAEPTLLEAMSRNGKRLVEDQFNEQNMVRQIVRAAQFAGGEPAAESSGHGTPDA